MNKNLFIFVFITFFLIGCAPSPERDGDKVPDQVEQEKIKDPRTIRLEYARQLLDKALEQKQPQQNQSYLEIIRLLYKYDPGGAELRLIEEVIALVDTTRLTPQQANQLVINTGRLYYIQEDFLKAQEALDAEMVSDDPEILRWYHHLRARIFDYSQQNIEAIREYIKLQPFLQDSSEKQANLESIWDILARFSLDELEQNIADYNFGDDTQLLGWQQLAYLVKSTPNRYLLNKKLGNWQVNFPEHMAGYQFIQAQLRRRFELLLQPTQIAILMPINGKLAKPAQTITNGIMAAHFQQPIDNELVIRFYDTSSSDSIWPVYKQAIYEGAEAVIGPLTKKHLTELTETEDLPVPTLALNQVVQEHRVKNLFQFGLLPEDEAIQVAQNARRDGHYFAAIMVPDSNWGKRLKKSFSDEWEKQGGKIVESRFYQTKTHDFSDPIKNLLNLDESIQRKQTIRQVLGKKVEFTPRIRQDIDMIFLAAFPKQARQIPLQISYYHGEDIPIYATSHIIAKVSDNKANKDLNGIIYTDMPWLLDSSQDAISRENQQNRTAYQRLFALGVDTYLVLPYLQFLEQNSVEFYHGETGKLSISTEGKLNRITPMGTIKNGHSRIIKAPKANYSDS